MKYEIELYYFFLRWSKRQRPITEMEIQNKTLFFTSLVHDLLNTTTETEDSFTVVFVCDLGPKGRKDNDVQYGKIMATPNGQATLPNGQELPLT